MAGHSKWKQIKRKRPSPTPAGALGLDQMHPEITVALPAAGIPEVSSAPDLPSMPPGPNMPNDNIDRAIKKGTGARGCDLRRRDLRGLRPGGAAIFVEGTTDNANRPAEVRHAFARNGGNLGA
ncbi:MAG: YebC/PmpR family DNA-binding transcriptional regulator [Gemmatimonadales bacterium]